MKKLVLTLSLFVFLVIISVAQNTDVIMKKIVYKVVDNKELHADMFYTASSQQKIGNPTIAFFHNSNY